MQPFVPPASDVLDAVRATSSRCSQEKKCNMNAQVDRWLTHIRVLAVDIGPRGPTTEGERRGAAYCATVLRQLGLAPQVQGFTSARSIFEPHLLAACALLLACALYPLAGRASAAVAAVISLAALVSEQTAYLRGLADRAGRDLAGSPAATSWQDKLR